MAYDGLGWSRMVRTSKDGLVSYYLVRAVSVIQ